MPSIPPAVQQAIDARQQATQQQIDIALLKKGLDASEQQAEAVNQLLDQAAELQRQIAEGHLDIKL